MLGRYVSMGQPTLDADPYSGGGAMYDPGYTAPTPAVEPAVEPTAGTPAPIVKAGILANLGWKKWLLIGGVGVGVIVIIQKLNKPKAPTLVDSFIDLLPFGVSKGMRKSIKRKAESAESKLRSEASEWKEIGRKGLYKAVGKAKQKREAARQRARELAERKRREREEAKAASAPAPKKRKKRGGISRIGLRAKFGYRKAKRRARRAVS